MEDWEFIPSINVANVGGGIMIRKEWGYVRLTLDGAVFAAKQQKARKNA